MGPVIRDNRRIDPVTGQPRRGRHAASQPAGTSGAGRPGGPGSRPIKADENARTPEEAGRPTEGGATTTAGPAAAPPPESAAASQLQSQLAERTADLQRLQAEY